MGKYKNANILQSAIDNQNEQQRLKEKHNIQNENVVVVEKTHFFKWLTLLFRVVFTIALFAVAAIGIFTLLYPDLRQEFLKILIETINSIGGK